MGIDYLAVDVASLQLGTALEHGIVARQHILVPFEEGLVALFKGQQRGLLVDAGS